MRWLVPLLDTSKQKCRRKQPMYIDRDGGFPGNWKEVDMSQKLECRGDIYVRATSVHDCMAIFAHVHMVYAGRTS